jgi:uncharacterized repeat protein (TIGR01451 family)
MAAPPALAQVAETFQDNTLSTPWTLDGSACLTATGGALSCDTDTVAPNYQDVDGEGWLRLTTGTTWKNGRVILNEPFPLANGFDLTFTYAMYGGGGAPGYAHRGAADGISVFLFDPEVTGAGSGGVPGGALGYCGTAGAILGIGLDAFGNFPNPNNPRGGCGDTGPGQQRSNISVRAGALATSPWAYLTGTNRIDQSTLVTDSAWSGASIDPTDLCPLDGTCERTGKQIHISFYPDSGCGENQYRILVESITNDTTIANLNDTTIANLCIQQSNLGTLPDEVELGLAASTGNNFQYQEIRDVDIRQVADISITKQYDKPDYVPGETGSYTIVVSNNGPTEVDGAVLTDPAVTGLNISRITCENQSETDEPPCPSARSLRVAALRGSSGIVIPALPPGSSLTFTLATTVAASMTGDLVNTATITPPLSTIVAYSGGSCMEAEGVHDSTTGACTATATTPTVEEYLASLSATPVPTLSNILKILLGLLLLGLGIIALRRRARR